MKIGRISNHREDRYDPVNEEYLEDQSFLVIDHREGCIHNYTDECQEIYIRDSLRLIFDLSIMVLVVLFDRLTWPIRRFFQRLSTHRRTRTS